MSLLLKRLYCYQRYWPLVFGLLPSSSLASDELETPSGFMQEAAAIMHRHQVPGLALAIINRGEINWLGGLGKADAVLGTPVATNSVFEAASLGKPVVTYATWRLIAQGRIDPNRPIAEYVELPAGSAERAAKITVAQLLQHTSGLGRSLNAELPLHPGFEPGSRWQYSGQGFALLQRVLESVTGKPLEAIVQAQVFQPLGMQQSSFVWQDWPDNLQTRGHDAQGRVQGKWQPQHALAAASLHTTIRDYASFVQAVIDPGQHDYALDSAGVDQLLSQRVTVNAELGLQWASGWGVEQYDSHEFIFHWGANPHFRSFVMASPDARSAVIMLSNSANGLAAIAEITTALYGYRHPLFDFYLLNPTD